jgi:tetratricopeptide (TPR) repeat protein
MDLSMYSLDGISTALASQESQRESVANSALSRGATLLQQKNYEQALVAFRQATAYKPDLTLAYRNMGNTYAMMGRTDEAIAAYKKAVRLDPTDEETINELANYLMTNERYAEAEQEFLRIQRINPTAVGPVASLGYVYLTTGRLAEAETQFAKSVRMAPRDAAAYYSLGLVYNEQERYTEAVDQFKSAIALRSDYAAAHADLAYAYFKMGDTDAADGEVKALLAINTDESNSLAGEIQLTMYTPKIVFEDIFRGSFMSWLGPGTPLDQLDASLATPGATNTFTLVLQFNQAMDIGSVQDVFNWSISKASGGTAGVYNNGVNLHPENEVTIMPFPTAVRYDPKNLRATIFFTVTQNAQGTGVIDPSHLVFRFRGTDVGGNPIDPLGDEYDRSAGHAF